MITSTIETAPKRIVSSAENFQSQGMDGDAVDGVRVPRVSDGQAFQSAMGPYAGFFDNDVSVNRIVSHVAIVFVFEGIPVDRPILSAKLTRIIHNVIDDILD